MNARWSASTLKHVVDATRGLFSEVNLHFSPAGVRMQAMDASHVSLVLFCVDAGDFDAYTCDKEFVAGVRIKALHDLLKMGSWRDVLTMQGGSTMDHLTFLLERPDGSRTSNFVLKLMDIEEELYDVPEVTLDADVAVASDEFFQICKDFSSVTDALCLEVDKVGCKLVGEGDMSSCAVVLHPSGTTQIAVQTPYKANFALRYVNLFASALSETVHLRFAKDTPMCVAYEFGNTGRSHLRFFLAPKMEDGA